MVKDQEHLVLVESRSGLSHRLHIGRRSVSGAEINCRTGMGLWSIWEAELVSKVVVLEERAGVFKGVCHAFTLHQGSRAL